MLVKYLVVALAWMLMASAHAYRFTDDFNKGFYWESFPVNIQKFVIDNSDGPLLNSLVTQAEAAWENSIGQNIWQIPASYVVTSGSTGNNIRWSNNFAADTGFDPSVTLAVTIRYNTGTYLTKTEIILNGQNQVLRQNVGNILYKTILHELGHTVGLDHSDQAAIMAPSISSLEDLQWDDQQGMSALYSETQYRQAIGYVSELAKKQEAESSALSCATVDFDKGDSGKGKRNGFLFSLLLGIFIAHFFKTRQIYPPHSK